MSNQLRRWLCRRHTNARHTIAAMASADRILYWGSGSTPCWRIQIALAEKELPCEQKLLQFSKSASSHRRDPPNNCHLLDADMADAAPALPGIAVLQNGVIFAERSDGVGVNLLGAITRNQQQGLSCCRS